jgi:hypothetical protein
VDFEIHEDLLRREAIAPEARPMMSATPTYAARLQIDYPERPLSRLTTFFRPIMAIPILIVLSLLSTSIAFATGLMIVFRVKYPHWWFDFQQELARLQTRVGAYGALLTDVYPSTTDEQAVHLELDYPNVETDLNRWLPLVKWLLAIPHYIVLFVLGVLAFFAVVVAWFAILFTRRYPRALFDFVVGVTRWGLRVRAYMSLLLTDAYPPFSVD